MCDYDLLYINNLAWAKITISALKDTELLWTDVGSNGITNMGMNEWMNEWMNVCIYVHLGDAPF